MHDEAVIKNLTISEWNDKIVHSLFPNIIILVTFLIISQFWNIFVMLVYIYRMKGNVEERYYIAILSIFDLIAATYCSSFMIYQCFNHVTFQNDTACKSSVFFVGFFSLIFLFFCW